VVSPQTRLALARHGRGTRKVVLPHDIDTAAAQAVYARQRRLALRSMAALVLLLLGPAPAARGRARRSGGSGWAMCRCRGCCWAPLPTRCLLALAWVHLPRRRADRAQGIPTPVTGLVVVRSPAALTVVIGTMGVRVIRGTDDFLAGFPQPSHRVLNGAAVAGEYLSLASFLGIAGLILRNGVGVLWYAVGFAAGFVTLLIWVAGPLRRSGAFTGGRLRGGTVRLARPAPPNRCKWCC